MKNFDSIIFDLGGVIVDIDPDRALESFSQLAGIPAADIEWQPHLSGFFHQFEIGKISEPEFRDELRSIIGKDVSDEALDSSWNDLIVDLPLRRLIQIQKLKGQYKVVLLSNTNPIHIRAVMQRLAKLTGQADFNRYFHGLHYSYELGLAKPDHQIFERVLDLNNFTADKTLLVDDSQDNIHAAAELGLQVLKVDKPDDWLATLT